MSRLPEQLSTKTGEAQKGLLQVLHQLREMLPADGQALGAHGLVQFVHAEGTTGMSQQLTHQPLQSQRVANVVPLHHIAQHRAVDIAEQQGSAAASIEGLHLGKTTLEQIALDQCSAVMLGSNR